MIMRSTLMAVGLAAALLIGGMTERAYAQDNSAQNLEITDELLAYFVGAAVAVGRVQEQWVPRIGAAETEADAQKLARRVQAAMKKAIEDSPGITLDEYMGIAQAAKADPDLALDLQARIKTAQGR